MNGYNGGTTSLDAWLEYVSRLQWQSVGMGLERMTEMVDRLALRRPAQHVITVAGTNGKGTTCHALERLLLGSGATVGTTLSPHIDRFNERIRLHGQELNDAEICRAFAAVEAARGDLTLTYFEYSTIAALWVFAQAKLDFAILEIGLGGRLDAFNVIAADTAIVTSIALDHQELLGDTLDAIGAEKAGIFRPGQQVALGSGMPNSVMARCDQLGLEPSVLGQHFRVTEDAALGTWQYESDDQIVSAIPIGQCGSANIALAYRAVTLIGVLESQSVAAREKLLRNASKGLSVKGRLQKFAWSGRTILCDVAHNPAGVEFLCRELALRGLDPDLIVCGMLTGKDHLGVYTTVSAKLCGKWAFLDTFGDRALSAGDLSHAVGLTQNDDSEARCFDLVTGLGGLASFLSSASNEGDVILVFGSFNAVEQSQMLMNHSIGAC